MNKHCRCSPHGLTGNDFTTTDCPTSPRQGTGQAAVEWQTEQAQPKVPMGKEVSDVESVFSDQEEQVDETFHSLPFLGSGPHSRL